MWKPFIKKQTPHYYSCIVTYTYKEWSRISRTVSITSVLKEYNKWPTHYLSLEKHMAWQRTLRYVLVQEKMLFTLIKWQIKKIKDVVLPNLYDLRPMLWMLCLPSRPISGYVICCCWTVQSNTCVRYRQSGMPRTPAGTYNGLYHWDGEWRCVIMYLYVCVRNHVFMRVCV